jgi:DNA-binding NtrC family response regulator
MGRSTTRVLVVDDEKEFCEVLFVLLKTEGFEPMVAHNGETAIDMIRRGLPDAVLLDVKMPGINGMEVLKCSRDIRPHIPILIMTAYGGVSGAVDAIKDGAFDYLVKPIDNRRLIEKLRRAVSGRKPLKPEPIRLNLPGATQRLRLDEIMGPSDAIAKVINDIELVASSDFTVIIQGETGTGKEFVARAIHQGSQRQRFPMIPVDCGAIPETLFESELFGHEKGAFTGAISHRAGKFEMAEGGTLFLDEIGNMPLSCQVKLLRAIQERTFFRVGGKEPVTVDVRLLVATNQDVAVCASLGTFCRDLFYRLSEFTIAIPPLRERKEDIVHLAGCFVRATNMELSKQVQGFSDAALEVLVEDPWPGNVRQLRSTVRRAVLQAEDFIRPEHLSVESPIPADNRILSHPDESSWNGLSLKEIVRRGTADLERRVLAQVLRKTKGNKAEAARLLHADYKTIHSKVKYYGISTHAEDDDEQEK